MPDVTACFSIPQRPAERRPIPGYEGIYEINTVGDVFVVSTDFRRRKSGQTIKPSPLPDGYICVSLCKDGKTVKRSVHSLVLRTFRPTDDPSLEVNHRDGNKANNSLSNLEWMSHGDNMRHARTIPGTWKCLRGERVGGVKLTADKVREIRRLQKQGLTQRDLSKMYGVSQVAIGFIVRRRTWAHIE